ncbi:MAG TPA: hypothetical protein VMM60_13205 [Ilumatobacter sp.]|nr:hypothetical protein [Ilumatobacter sp.]
MTTPSSRLPGLAVRADSQVPHNTGVKTHETGASLLAELADAPEVRLGHGQPAGR